MSVVDSPAVSGKTEELHFFEVFPWNSNFNTGHSLIDEQHKKLVDLLNDLANTLVGNQQSEVELAFSELANYADYHFAAEEEIWSDCFGNDNWFHSHQLTHSSFLPKVLEIKKENDAQPLYLVVEDIVKFLIRWLAFHIINEDTRYAIVVSEVAAGKSLEEAKTSSDRKMNASSVRVLIETVLTMYDGLSNRALNLLRERRARIAAEAKLKQAYLDLEAANRHLEESSITDQLTALHNRRHFESIFARELQRAKREFSHLTLVLLDIDHFKKLNDRYGHLGGDQALIKVGSKLSEICRRSGDYAFRIGGEEFAFLACGHAGNSFGSALAAVILKEIHSLRIPNEDSEVLPTLTISLGVLSKVPDPEDTAESIFRIADQRLYIAKQRGRNRAVCE